jgi:alpha-mannosidase
MNAILALACAASILAADPIPDAEPVQPAGENAAQQRTRVDHPSERDLADPENKALYAVGYAHLDTQWRWDFVTTIDEYIRATLDDNFALFEQHPDYTFNFTGSVRYEMMREYYPERYKRLKEYIAQGRWRVAGSSVDEGDVNVPSAEAIVRQVLYGNKFFREEFGVESLDFMLPDCFGFPASLPSIWAHCGLLGFSTQKLTWGSAVGIPFKVGVWEGPDGNGVIAALDPGPYVGAIDGPPDQSVPWIERVLTNGKQFNLWADYHYYGVGDQGGAPKAEDVARYIASANEGTGPIDVLLAPADQMYKDITPEVRANLPRFAGDMLLTEHSAGTLTSQAYMKRWNRQAEQLADAAERAATAAWLLTGAEYPTDRLERAWVRVLANQMHDILPGTSIPRAYRYSWNDEIVAMNIFADVLTHAVGHVAARLDTEVEGIPLVVFNPISCPRRDLVEATVPLGHAPAIRVFDRDSGREVPSQVLSRDDGDATILFEARVLPNSFTVFDVRAADGPYADDELAVTPRSIENSELRVTLNDAGDIEQIFDRATGREILAALARLAFTYEKPRNWPAWNMDWADRKNPPIGHVDGPVTFRIVERGPVRAAIEVTRHARGSSVTQVLRLARAGAADFFHSSGRVLEVACDIDWQSAECALKASFPLTASNPVATYNWGMGTIERGNNNPVKYEVPSHEWIDLTDASGEFGVSILEDSKFGSDKPSDHEIRLTLLYTPGVRGSYMDQHSQDWGRHDIRYAIYPHEGDHRDGHTYWMARRFNQPLRAFGVPASDGGLGPSARLVEPASPQFDIVAIKRAEERDAVVLRTQELRGEPLRSWVNHWWGDSSVAYDADGQERILAERPRSDGFSRPVISGPFEPKTLMLVPGAIPNTADRNLATTLLPLPYDTDVASTDADPSDGAMDHAGRSYPAEMLPRVLLHNDVPFALASTDPGANNAVTCRGQQISIPDRPGTEIHLLAAATIDCETIFTVGDFAQRRTVQEWTGFVGQWDDRVFDRAFAKVDYRTEGRVVAINPGYIKRQPIAWFATHHHHPTEGNQAYQFSYLFHVRLDRPAGARALTLPYDERVRVFGATLVKPAAALAVPAAPLYDTLEGHGPIAIRHDYDARPPAIHDGLEPSAAVTIDREREWDLLAIGPPSNTDAIDASRSNRAFRAWTDDGRLPVHHASGAEDGALPRLTDGDWARNHDDTARCVWFDNEGRFTLDLGEPTPISRLSVYSWHRSDRAVQKFSVWASNAESPSPAITREDRGDWVFLAAVDTSPLGQGDKHASSIRPPGDTPLGPWRHLLFVAEDMGQGTFFTEIDLLTAGGVE